MTRPDIIALIRGKLDELGPHPSQVDADIRDLIDRTRDWHDRTDRLADDLRRQIGARIRQSPATGTTVRIDGLACSSTSGVVNALRGWIAKAERQLATEGASC